MRARAARLAEIWRAQSPDDRGGLVIWAVPALALLVLGIGSAPRAGWTDPLDGLAEVGQGIVWAAVVGAGAWLWWRLRGLRGATGKARGLVGHSHGVGRVLLRHEGGHVVGAKSLGAFARAWVKPDSGYVRLQRSKVDKLTPAQYLAFCKVGELAAGTSAGCSGDRRNYRAELGRMRASGASAAEIAKAERIGTMMAARWAASPDVDRWADRLGERGRM